MYFIGKNNEHFYVGEAVRTYRICGPFLRGLNYGDKIPDPSEYTLEVLDGQISWFPEQGYLKFRPYDPNQRSLFLYEYDNIEKL